jgi:hypothetical protein
MRRRILSLLAPLLALTALAAPALAQAEPVTLQAGGEPLSTGAHIKLNSTNLISTSAITLKCNVQLKSFLTENPGASGLLTGAQFQNAEGGSQCPTDSSLTWSVTGLSFETQNGMQFSAEDGEGLFQINPMKVTLGFYSGGVKAATCNYLITSNEGHFPLNQPLDGENIAWESEWELTGGESSASCSNNRTFSADFSLTTEDDEAIEAVE